MKKKYRVTRNEEFTKIMNKKKYLSCPFMTIYTHNREAENSRVGISVPKKIGNAVVRNKVKRQIRMMCQELFTFDEKFDTIILVRVNYLSESYINNKKSLERLIKNVRI